MFKHKLLTAAIAVTFAVSGSVLAGGIKSHNFKPLDESANSADWDPASPWKLPKGFKQWVVSDESNLNIYNNGRDDWHDMNTVNETGPEKGCFMYRGINQDLKTLITWQKHRMATYLTTHKI
jgi:hypothetical protein